MHYSTTVGKVRILSTAALALVCVFFTGCKHGNAINFVTNTQFGLKVGVNAEKIPEVQIGYNRQEAARVPVYLEQQKDPAGVSPTTPSVNATLNQVIAELQKNTGEADKIARGLIDQIAKIPNQTGAPPKSELIALITNNVKDLSLDATKRGVIMSLIRAELDRPKALFQFYEQGKYVGSREGGKLTDAYSVFGTFSGTASGGVSGGSNGSVRVAQFFATGVAAQLLAEGGGAAAVNPLAKTPGEVLSAADIQRIKSETRRQDQEARDRAQNLARYVLSGTTTEAQRLQKLKTLQSGGNVPPDGVLTKLSQQTSENGLTKKLRDLTDDEQQMMSSKLPH